MFNRKKRRIRQLELEREFLLSLLELFVSASQLKQVIETKQNKFIPINMN